MNISVNFQNYIILFSDLQCYHLGEEVKTAENVGKTWYFTAAE